MDYSEYRTQMAGLLVYNLDDAADAVRFDAILPDIITYAEQRIYQDLDLLSTVTSNSSGTLTASNRNFTFPSHFVVTNQINVITPSTTTNPNLGTRNVLLPVSLDYLNAAYPSVTGAGVPSYFAMVTDQSIAVGPWPDAAYTVEVVGTQRPTGLSNSNTETWISLYIPQVFIAASMVYGSGYQKNFGSMSDDPKMAQSWEAQYQTLKGSALVEQFRTKWMSNAWGSQLPPAIATPPRT